MYIFISVIFYWLLGPGVLCRLALFQSDFVPMGKNLSDKTTHEKPLIWLSKRCSDMDKGGFSHTPVLRFTISWPHILNTGHFCCGPTHLFWFSSNNVVIKAVVFVVVAFFNVFY